MKTCTRCEQTKSLSDFGSNRTKRDGLQPWCKDCFNKYNRDRYHVDPAHGAAQSRAKHRRRKMEALIAYGGPQCRCCDEDTVEFLTIDHINGDGAIHRKAEPRANSGLYYWLKKRGYPAGFQVLCYNCNIARSKFGACPHQTRKARAA